MCSPPSSVRGQLLLSSLLRCLHFVYDMGHTVMHIFVSRILYRNSQHVGWSTCVSAADGVPLGVASFHCSIPIETRVNEQ